MKPKPVYVVSHSCGMLSDENGEHLAYKIDSLFANHKHARNRKRQLLNDWYDVRITTIRVRDKSIEPMVAPELTIDEIAYLAYQAQN